MANYNPLYNLLFLAFDNLAMLHGNHNIRWVIQTYPLGLLKQNYIYKPNAQEALLLQKDRTTHCLMSLKSCQMLCNCTKNHN